MAWIPAVTWINGNPRLQHMMAPSSLLFDGKRMFRGGFDVLLEL